MESSSKKSALVAGANKGIGLEIARQLGKAGFVVFLGARNAAAGEAAAAKLRAEGLAVHPVELDLNRKETRMGGPRRERLLSRPSVRPRWRILAKRGLPLWIRPVSVCRCFQFQDRGLRLSQVRTASRSLESLTTGWLD
ncbi:MAG: SDR family NAD(P)-dependent oxidoreductase [Bryobacteraceae bacterium]